MIDLLQENQIEISSICEQFGVSRLDVFGSAARGDHDPETSDLDFMIEFLDYGPGIASRYFGFVAAIEQQLGLKVDAVFGPRVKCGILQEEIDRDRALVYESPRREIAA